MSSMSDADVLALSVMAFNDDVLDGVGEKFTDVRALTSAAHRLLREKRALEADGRTRPVYRLRDDTRALTASLFHKPGEWVAVRPCADRHRGKTYLGILVGDLALSIGARRVDDPQAEPSTHTVELAFGHHNPLILIPELGETVLGCGSWWGPIRGPADLKRITDSDIQSTWYVRMLKDLEKTEDAP